MEFSTKIRYINFKTYKHDVMLDPRSEKLNYEIDGRCHYVYRITDLETGLYYYGTKSEKKITLGKKYLSSSKK